MGIKALFTYDYGKEKMDSIKKLGYDITIIHESKIMFCQKIAETEVLVCYNPFNTLDITKFSDLKWIQFSSTGIDQLPMDVRKDASFIVTNNRGGYSIPIGEWVILSTLEMFKRSKNLFRQQQNKKWKMDTSVLEVYGKTIGFIGTGTIAIEAAKRFQGFGVRVLGLNTKGKSVEYFERCFPVYDIDKMLSLCDVVVVTIPSTEKTYKFINKHRFAAMKNGVYFINVARGNVIDEEALIENICKGKIGAAALDVFEDEPLNEKSPLWEFENVIVTPHNSWVSEMRNERRFEGIYENMKRYAANEKLLNIIDLSKGY